MAKSDDDFKFCCQKLELSILYFVNKNMTIVVYCDVIVYMCALLDCQYEVNHNTEGADSSTDSPNDKTLGLYLVCCINLFFNAS